MCVEDSHLISFLMVKKIGSNWNYEPQPAATAAVAHKEGRGACMCRMTKNKLLMSQAQQYILVETF